MSDVQIFLYSSCTSCRKAETLLQELDVSAERRDYFKNRFTRDELSDLLSQIGKTPYDVLSIRSNPYKALNLGSKSVSDDELLDLMVEYPQLLKRPIVVHDGVATVGFNRDAISNLVKGR